MTYCAAVTEANGYSNGRWLSTAHVCILICIFACFLLVTLCLWKLSCFRLYCKAYECRCVAFIRVV